MAEYKWIAQWSLFIQQRKLDLKVAASQWQDTPIQKGGYIMVTDTGI
jgi:hypothetical protein